MESLSFPAPKFIRTTEMREGNMARLMNDHRPLFGRLQFKKHRGDIDRLPVGISKAGPVRGFYCLAGTPKENARQARITNHNLAERLADDFI
jgi:hypothetical protein